MNTPQSSTVRLIWTSRKEWGSLGNTHRASFVADGVQWSFAVDQPRNGFWVLRAWRDGVACLYRDASTARACKAEAQAWLDRNGVHPSE